MIIMVIKHKMTKHICWFLNKLAYCSCESYSFCESYEPKKKKKAMKQRIILKSHVIMMEMVVISIIIFYKGCL